MPLPLTAKDAARLAVYRGASGRPSVLAPRGWVCRETLDSSGSWLYIAPSRPERLTPFVTMQTPLDGPAVVVFWTASTGSGAYETAKLVARGVFPAHKELANLKQHGVDIELRTTPFANDKLHYLGDSLVEFRTPPHSAGLGTWPGLRPGVLPSTGLALLTPQWHDLVLLCVRVPELQAALAPIIVRQLEREIDSIVNSR